MSREIGISTEVGQIVKIGGSYKTVFSAPVSTTPCKGIILEQKTKGIIDKEKWFASIHLDGKGNTKYKTHCLGVDNK
jgi:hypothetical protein